MPTDTSSDLTVVVTSWPSHPRRISYFCQTVDAFAGELARSGLKANWIVSAETERPADSRFCGDELQAACDSRGLPLFWRTAKADLAANLNESIARVQTDLWFYLQDDWLLIRKLPLRQSCELLRKDPGVGGVRFWANTEHWLTWGRWSVLRKHAPWYYGDNPALWSLRFNRAIGPFEPGGAFGHHESAANHAASSSGLHLVAPLPVRKSASWYFSHLGEVTSVPCDPRWDHAEIRRAQNEGMTQ